MRPNPSSRVLIALVALALAAFGVRDHLEAQEKRSGSGRARVLVAVFQPSQGVDEDFGKEIAEKLRERVSGFELLTAVTEDEVEESLDKFGLESTRMDLIQWRQLASRLNAQLIVYGEIERSGSSSGYGVRSVFVEASRGDTTNVPDVSVQGDGGDEAEEVADRISQTLSDHVDFLRARLNCQDYLSSDQFDDAARNCDQALSIRPNNAQALYLRGRIAVERENWQEAVDFMSRALEQSSSHEAALQSLAYAHAQAGNRDESVEYYRQYLEFNPGDTDVRLSVAYNLANAGAFESAMQILRDGVERDSTSAALWKYLGDVAIRRGTAGDKASVGGSSTISDTAAIRTALDAYQKYASLEPDSVDAGLYRNMIGAHMQLGELEAAARASREALQQVSDSPSLWSIRADVASRQENLDRAVSAMDSVIALDSTYANAYFKRGIYKLRNGASDAALSDFRTAVESGTDPNTIAQQLFATGHSDYFKQGDYRESADMFEAGLEFAREQQLSQRLHFWAGYSFFRLGERIDKGNQQQEACGAAQNALGYFEQVLPNLNQAGSYQKESQGQIRQAVDVYLYRQKQIIKKSC
jgi:tetratricopeptide (TPR) repeat protein